MFQVAASSWWLSVGVDKDVNAPIRYGRHRLYHFRPFAQNSGSVFVVLRPQLIIIIKCIFCEKRKRRNNDYTVQVSKSDSIKRLPRRSTAECFAGAVRRWLTSNLQTRWLLLASSRDCLLFFFFLANFLCSFVDRMYAHVQFQRCFPSFERGSLPAVWDCGTRRVCVVIGFGPSKLIGSGYR